MYLIRNKDGSIKKAFLNEFVNQGSNNVNYIDLAIEGLEIGEWSADCLFELPNGEIVQLAGVQKEFSVDSTTYKGYRISLSSAVLSYAGILKGVARNYDAYGNILYSYPFEIMVNATTLDSAYDAPITIAQYNAFMKLLATYINAYDTHLIRKYDTLANANRDINNLTESEHVFISDGTGGYSIYYKAKAEDNALTHVATVTGDMQNYVKFTDLMTLETAGVAKAVPTTDVSSLQNVYIYQGMLYSKANDMPIITLLFVDSLPDTGNANVLYLVSTETANVYDEYMWVDDAWKQVGSSTITFVDSAFVISGSVPDNDEINFIDLDISKLLSYIKNRQCITFDPTTEGLPTLNLAIRENSENNYTLTGSYVKNVDGVSICYSCEINVVDEVISGTYKLENISQELEVATSEKLGGVRVGYTTTTADNKYAVLLDENERMYCYVPVSESYTLPIATGSTLGGIKTGYTTTDKNYKVSVDSNGNAYCNVNWTDTTYNIATSTANGLMSASDKQTLDNVSSIYLKKADNYAYGINTFTTNNDYVSQMSIKSKDGNAYTIKFADTTTLVDLSSNQTISGTKTFTSEIKTNYVRSQSGYNLIQYAPTASKVVVGCPTTQTTILGNTERPYYSNNSSDLTGVPLALLSDCSGGGGQEYATLVETLPEI